MHINTAHILRKLGRHYMIVDGGTGNAVHTNVYTLNETAAFLWNSVAGTDFDCDTLVRLLCDNYDVAPDTARADAAALLARWLELGLVIG